MVGDIWPAHIGLGWQPTMKTGEGQAMASGAVAQHFIGEPAARLRLEWC
jgi:hypothetical protein